ncbi:MAG: histidine kinase dimerization/phospho-acceptor domain-containing protein [Rhodothermales bacterium]
MEALGTLASGIAHDFNNILGSILGYTELLLNKQFGNGADKQYLSQVYQSGQRAAKLIDQILIFVRPGTVELEVIDFEKVLRSSVEMMRSSLPASICYS